MPASMPIERRIWCGRGHKAAHQPRSGIEVAGNIAPAALGLARFACDKGIAKDFKPARVQLSFCAGEGIDRRADTNLHKTTVLEHRLPGCTRQTAGNSGCPKL